MVRLRLDDPEGGPLQVLCLGAHSDDIEIGCGGTILQLLRQRPGARVHWVVFSAPEPRAQEARRSAAKFLEGAGEAEVITHDFHDGFLPYVGGDVKGLFESLKGRIRPDLVFTHHERDRHQDHRLICDLTWNTFRDHLVLEYEIPKFDGDLTTPNLYVPLQDKTRHEKLRHLMESFTSQRQKPWFTEDTFNSLLRLRGVECASPTGFAEAFHVRKARLLL